jgi:hypothetical protein
MAAEIIVTIKPDGSTSVEVEGATGGNCTNLTASLEAALGAANNKEYKAEFYQQDQRIRAQN